MAQRSGRVRSRERRRRTGPTGRSTRRCPGRCRGRRPRTRARAAGATGPSESLPPDTATRTRSPGRIISKSSIARRTCSRQWCRKHGEQKAALWRRMSITAGSRQRRHFMPHRPTRPAGSRRRRRRRAARRASPACRCGSRAPTRGRHRAARAARPTLAGARDVEFAPGIAQHDLHRGDPWLYPSPGAGDGCAVGRGGISAPGPSWAAQATGRVPTGPGRAPRDRPCPAARLGAAPRRGSAAPAAPFALGCPRDQLEAVTRLDAGAEENLGRRVRHAAQGAHPDGEHSDHEPRARPAEAPRDARGGETAQQCLRSLRSAGSRARSGASFPAAGRTSTRAGRAGCRHRSRP